jgi:hypothetical protein
MAARVGRVAGRRRAAVAVLVAGALVLLVGCGRTVDAVAGSAAVAGGNAADPATTGAAAGPATARSTASPHPEAAVDPVDQLRRSLLGPRDLGPGWTPGDPPLPDASAPAPCGGPGTVARYPDALRVGSTVEGPSAGLVVQEGLSVYGDADTAHAAFEAGVAGLDCGQGTLHGASVALARPQDLRPDVGGDLASGWRATSDTVDATLVVVQARQAVFTFAYVVPAGSAALGRPDPVALSRVAVARALAA